MKNGTHVRIIMTIYLLAANNHVKAQEAVEVKNGSQVGHSHKKKGQSKSMWTTFQEDMARM